MSQGARFAVLELGATLQDEGAFARRLRSIATTRHTQTVRVDLTFWRFDLCEDWPRANEGSARCEVCAPGSASSLTRSAEAPISRTSECDAFAPARTDEI